MKEKQYVRREAYGIVGGPFALALVVFIFNALGIIDESIATALGWFVIAGMSAGLICFGATCCVAFRKTWGIIYIILGFVLIAGIYILKTLGLVL